MTDEESHIEKLENQFPAVSGSAFAEARAKVLASGQSVLQSENGVIFEVFPDGSRRAIKSIAAPTAVVPGQKIAIR